MGNFEYALVLYHRGHKLHPVLQEFRLGVQKAQEAIENSVGSSSALKLEENIELPSSKQEEVPKQKFNMKIKRKDEGQQKKKIREIPKNEEMDVELVGAYYIERLSLEGRIKDFLSLLF
ncbi:outer dynein arm-docking complex subunit 4-like [Protopterus annectens]|uniref:outer dynein arm-docking complex subunit 4-like n=1 Tax=Protopterus annectens TaxID=7888 RepID=UPI001CFAD653|nr:outer dynein arm-docking complex subunit 4-like [Protopterus annectens]